MKAIKIAVAFSATGLLLSACGTGQQQPLGEIETIDDAGLTEAEGQEQTGTGSAWTDMSDLQDAQGSVTVIVTPLNLDPTSETIDFIVALDTHSVDLSMDLSTLATLSTDGGQSVEALAWSGTPGGHHVEGTLSFPASVNGEQLLDYANQLTLTILNVDAPVRTFAWSR